MINSTAAMTMTKPLCFLFALQFLASDVGAQETGSYSPAIDKSVFNLFNPTPKPYLRDLIVDGPGATESPYTVDAGHFQVEMAFVSYSTYRESVDGATYRLEWWAIAPMNLKLGLLNRLDVQLLLEPYNIVYEHEGDYYRATWRGFGDTTLRLKYNFWGNDAGRTAFAATPYVKFPTSQQGLGNNSIEGGIVLQLAVELPQNFHLGLASRFAAVRNFDQPGYHAEFANSIAVEHDLIKDTLAGYVEFFSLVSKERDVGWIGTFDTGLIYWLSDNVQLNAGVNFGLTRSADQWNPFVGMAWRF